MHRNLVVGGEKEQVAAGGHSGVGHLADQPASRLNVLAPLVQIEPVRLLEDLLQERLQLRRRGHQHRFCLRSLEVEVLTDLLGLGHPHLIPVEVRPPQRFDRGLGLRLGHVPHQDQHGALLQKRQTLLGRAGQRLPRLDLLEQLGDEIRLLAHDRVPRSKRRNGERPSAPRVFQPAVARVFARPSQTSSAAGSESGPRRPPPRFLRATGAQRTKRPARAHRCSRRTATCGQAAALSGRPPRPAVYSSPSADAAAAAFVAARLAARRSC